MVVGSATGHGHLGEPKLKEFDSACPTRWVSGHRKVLEHCSGGGEAQSEADWDSGVLDLHRGQGHQVLTFLGTTDAAGTK